MFVDVLNIDGNKIKDIDFLPYFENIETIDTSLVHECVVCYLNNQRQGNSSTKTRGEVSGGGNKPWKQKGTGRARAGSNRSPIWRHGGIAFGPQKRNYYYSLSHKKKRLGFLYSLLLKKREGNLIALDNFLGHNINKTKEISLLLKKLILDSDKIKKLFSITEDDFVDIFRQINNFLREVNEGHIKYYKIEEMN